MLSDEEVGHLQGLEQTLSQYADLFKKAARKLREGYDPDQVAQIIDQTAESLGQLKVLSS